MWYQGEAILPDNFIYIGNFVESTDTGVRNNVR